jgi:hypothetical protein
MSEKPWDGRFAEGTDKSRGSLYRFDSPMTGGYIPTTSPAAWPTAVCWPRSASCRMRRRPSWWKVWVASSASLDSGSISSSTTAWKTSTCTSSRACCRMWARLAQKLHTARSRNDQVALDTRMYLRDAARRTIAIDATLRAILVDLAEAISTLSCRVIPICSGPNPFFCPSLDGLL